MQAVCDPGVSESDWVGTTVKLFDLQSTANWYSFVLSCSEHPDWMYKYITFSMQNLANADTASESFYNYPTTSTYANGYVWAIFTDYSLNTYHLIRAPLDNVNKTIGSFETAMTDFDTVYIPSMAFNPNDARIYYVSGDSKLKSFDPSHPDQVTEIGSYTQDFMSIAINSTGNAYCIDQNYDLYTIDLTDASVSLVGNAPDVEVLAFDLETDEFYGVALSGYGRILCTIDPATAAKEELEYVGGASTIYITSIFMASSSANICYAPANVSINSIGLHNATIGWDAGSNANGWIVEYATASDFSNATTVNVTTNSCPLSGLTDGTVYYVRVKADCGADGESYWTVRSFNTHFCESANQCEISYELADSYGDGWNSGAINVVDVASNVVVGTLTMFGGSSLSGTLPVCDGREIRFEWVNGNFDYETSYTVYDANGDTIFSGSDAMSVPVPYTMSCPMSPGLISIGSCTSGSEYLPGSSYYNFNISQQIYTAAEIGQAGTISSVSFYNDGYTRTRTYDMYLVHTNKSAFSGGGDWVPVTAGDLVFSGSVAMEAGEWTAIDLDVPFQYNGTDNLLLVMDDNSNSYSQGMSCYTFNTTDLQALYNHDDYTNYDPFAPASYTGYPVAYKNCIRLNFGTVCMKPKNLTHTVSNQNDVTLTWESNATSFNVNYK